jgi:hypothetical protein
MSGAAGQYKGWPRVVREMATHFLNSTLVEISLNNGSVVEIKGVFYGNGRSFHIL